MEKNFDERQKAPDLIILNMHFFFIAVVHRKSQSKSCFFCPFNKGNSRIIYKCLKKINLSIKQPANCVAYNEKSKATDPFHLPNSYDTGILTG